MPFTVQELEEMRLADEEIEREFCQTQEEIEASRRRDRRAEFEALPIEKRKVAASKKAWYEANREKVVAYQKAWYEANREKVAAYQKARYEANREKVAASQKAYREANREKVAASQKAWYEANREKVAASQKAYREANREKVAASKKAWYEANREKVAASQNWIAAARKAAGYTQADVAHMIGVSAASVSNLESGKMNLENFAKKSELEELLK